MVRAVASKHFSENKLILKSANVKITQNKWRE